MNEDQSGLAGFLKREKNRLLGYVRRRLSRVSFMDAEDIVSDVVLGMVRKADLFGEVENLTAYAYRSLENRIIDHLRGVRETVPLDGDESSDPGLEASDRETPERASARRELRERLRQAVHGLPPAERAVWLATEIEGRSFKELAAESGEPIGTLLSRKSRANARLREQLKDYHSS